MKKKHYMVAKKNQEGIIAFVDYSKIEGFKVTPKNNLGYPGIEVNSLILVKPTFIEKVLKRKIKRKLDYYLKYIIQLIEDVDDDDGIYRQALNDMTRYKEIVEYKYRKYLDDKYINLLLKKIDALDREMKSKIIYKKLNLEEKSFDYEEEIVEERRRSR